MSTDPLPDENEIPVEDNPTDDDDDQSTDSGNNQGDPPPDRD